FERSHRRRATLRLGRERRRNRRVAGRHRRQKSSRRRKQEPHETAYRCAMKVCSFDLAMQQVLANLRDRLRQETQLPRFQPNADPWRAARLKPRFDRAAAPQHYRCMAVVLPGMPATANATGTPATARPIPDLAASTAATEPTNVRAALERNGVAVAACEP